MIIGRRLYHLDIWITDHDHWTNIVVCSFYERGVGIAWINKDDGHLFLWVAHVI